MTDLADFLLARIDEDEAVARAATAGPWEVRPYWFTSDTGRPYAAAVPGVISEEINPEDAEHIARWDPGRALAECEVKRRIVEWVTAAQAAAGDPPGFDPEDAASLSHVLHILAMPYADHPDFREEWRA